MHMKFPKIHPGRGYRVAVKGTQHTKKMMSVAARFAAWRKKQHAGR